MSRQGHLIVAHPDVQGHARIKLLKDVAACHFGMLGEAVTGLGRAEIQPCYAVPGKGTCLGCKSHWVVVSVGVTDGAVSPPCCGNLLLKLLASVILQVPNCCKCYFMQVISHWPAQHAGRVPRQSRHLGITQNCVTCCFLALPRLILHFICLQHDDDCVAACLLCVFACHGVCSHFVASM